MTAGDLLARDTVVRWLGEEHVAADVAVAPGFRRSGEIALDDADPARYSHLVFVCGPAGGDAVERLFARFSDCARIAIGVSVVDGTAQLAPLQLFPRDSHDEASPDLSLWAEVASTPVVGVIRAHPQPEYGERQAHTLAHEAIDDLLRASDVARVELDTRLDLSDPGFCRTPSQLVSLVGRLDATITTRLHGLVLSLKAGVPALALDPISGGGKVIRQARALNWPAVQSADALSGELLAHWLSWCLSDEARRRAREAAQASGEAEPRLREALLSSLVAEGRAL